jgi:hypothetical protein
MQWLWERSGKSVPSAHVHINPRRFEGGGDGGDNAFTVTDSDYLINNSLITSSGEPIGLGHHKGFVC